MCGIAGIVDTSGAVPEVHQLNVMHEILAHRGPDDHGVHSGPGIGLSHRRLSVIDLSSDGHQPMPNEDQSMWVVYNGEIYNYRELARELEELGHRFRSHSDTEVIIHAFEQWGASCVDRFNGMFALAIWDAARKSFFAARDRLGIKPFYYWFDGRRLVFGSEIKAILTDPRVSIEPELDSIRQYLLLGNTTGDRTWYRNIRQLPPGHVLHLADGRLTVREYWDVQFAPDYSRSPESFSEELRALLIDAVHLQLRSDVPVGAHLSGGVDSSTIVALAARELDGLHTFSAAYATGPDYDERSYIDLVSRRFHTTHHVVLPGAGDLRALLPKLLWHLDEPVIGAAILPMYRVSELVRSTGVKVVNGGQGADESFGGYPPYFVLACRNLLDGLLGSSPRGPTAELWRIPSYLIKGGAVERIVNRLVRSNTPGWIRDSPNARQATLDYVSVVQRRHPKLQAFEQNSYFQLKHYLPGLLQQEDRMSMAWSIESRVPLLDHRIVELSAKVPSWFKIRNGSSKAILRMAARGITPNGILDRKDKKGYPVPTRQWFRGELADYIREVLVDTPLRADDLLDRQSLRQVIRENESGRRDHSGAIWRALNTEIWFRQLALPAALRHGLLA